MPRAMINPFKAEPIPHDMSGVLALLKQNKNLNFVKRIIYPENYPILDNGDGSFSTHLMGWGDVGEGIDKRYRVYPNIVHDENTNKLIKFTNGSDAMRYASKTGEYIDFDDPDDADWFSKEYKMVWDIPGAGMKAIYKGPKL